MPLPETACSEEYLDENTRLEYDVLKIFRLLNKDSKDIAIGELKKAKVCPNCMRTLSPKHGCLIAVIMFFIIISIAIAVSIGDGDSNKPTESKSGTDKTQSNEESEETKTDEYTKLNKSGEIIEGVTLTVNSVKKTDRIDLYDKTMYSYPKDKNAKFLITNVTINNKSNDAQDLNMIYFNIIGPDSEEYVPTVIVGADEEYITLDAVNPKLKVKGNIAFEVPKDLDLKKSKLCYNKRGIFDSNHYFRLK